MTVLRSKFARLQKPLPILIRVVVSAVYPGQLLLVARVFGSTLAPLVPVVLTVAVAVAVVLPTPQHTRPEAMP